MGWAEVLPDQTNKDLLVKSAGLRKKWACWTIRTVHSKINNSQTDWSGPRHFLSFSLYFRPSGKSMEWFDSFELDSRYRYRNLDGFIEMDSSFSYLKSFLIVVLTGNLTFWFLIDAMSDFKNRITTFKPTLFVIDQILKILEKNWLNSWFESPTRRQKYLQNRKKIKVWSLNTVRSGYFPPLWFIPVFILEK